MAFIVLRRSRNTRSYYLVESYRDEQGRARNRVLCYLGREQDGTDTLAKAIAHWQKIEYDIAAALPASKGQRRGVLQGRQSRAQARIELLRRFLDQTSLAEKRRLERQRQREAEQVERQRRAEEAEHWQAIEQLHRFPSEVTAQAAKRAYRLLALRLHPDQGGSHEGFVRLKKAYDQAADRWRRVAG